MLLRESINCEGVYCKRRNPETLFQMLCNGAATKEYIQEELRKVVDQSPSSSVVFVVDVGAWWGLGS